jgi:uncharacterized RDD family membrane protein YckC
MDQTGGALLAVWAIGQVGSWFTGRSLGKWVSGLRVYTVWGEPAGFDKMALREAWGKLWAAMWFFTGFLQILSNSDRRAMYDESTNTVVIDTSTASQKLDIPTSGAATQ